MRSLVTFILTVILVAVCAPARAQVVEGNSKYDTVAKAIPGVIAEGARIQFLREGFSGTEGPIAIPDGTVVFTDTFDDWLVRIDSDGNRSNWLSKTGHANGLAFDSQGRLIAVQTTPGKTGVAVIYPPGKEMVLSDNYNGKPYSRPNDLVVDKKGGVYFTDFPGADGKWVLDPLNGTTNFAAEPGVTPPPPSLPPAVYYLPPGGKSIEAATGIGLPNGVQLSPDERTLYVNDTRGEYMIAFDVQPDGTLRNRRNFAQYVGVTRNGGQIASGADGLAIDSQGRIYTTSNAGVDVFSPQGQHLGTIPTQRRPQNLAFAGKDKKTLYIVGRGGVFKVQMLAQGYMGRAK